MHPAFYAFGFALVASSLPAAAQNPPACPAVLQHQFPRLQDEAPQNLCQYTGKVVLVVNTASYCGFAGQFEGLEALYAKQKDKGLVVLGFPSNDFAQEAKTSKEIADFCFNTYGVKFPMLGKSVVSGAGKNAFYAELVKATGQEPRWNFYKYLIDRKGQVVDSYNSMTGPDSPKLVAAIDKALAQKP
ncbi:glutathione peroxidase [Rhodoferax sp.]|uniref:glutathione peroxidase n=1 Tax=Rhodoferax sp. TaxID=50421 RepID=UPI0025E14035|nr:glutathione peroxidase [Rhodoferax sp.]